MALPSTTLDSKMFYKRQETNYYYYYYKMFYKGNLTYEPKS